jgi:deoxyribodipyrimidine photolyase-related protein
MSHAVLIFPNQLFYAHPAFTKTKRVLLLEHSVFFTAFAFHKKKLFFHRASMKAYAKQLEGRGFSVSYIDAGQRSPESALFEELKKQKIRKLYLADPVDFDLLQWVEGVKQKFHFELHLTPTPQFLTPEPWLRGFFQRSGSYRMQSFYIAQRKRLGVLLEPRKPAGGKWSFDRQNRKKLPSSISIPSLPRIRPNRHMKEAEEYVEKHFPKNPGDIKPHLFPVTRRGALRWLDDFLANRFQSFGPYEDAMSRKDPFLFHSLLTPFLNTGLLTPDEVLQKALAFSETKRIPLNSLEGFVRQLIGWREFMRAVYLLEGKKQKAGNFWKHRRALPRAFYRACTGIDPVDTTIKRVLRHAYAHHIERLMILGTFMLLCELHPAEVYRWFMELFIDAYEWVMVPNVFGMSQYADGGRITTKPYLCSSNYIRTMSNYPKGPWCAVWDGLFWRFVHTRRKELEKNPRMTMMSRLAKRMDPKTRREHTKRADRFLNELFSSPGASKVE